VVKGEPETALVYLNKDNAEKLESQLQQQHHISIKEFTEGDDKKEILRRYDRTSYLKLPKIDFYQFKIKYNTLVVEEATPEKDIPQAVDNTEIAADVTRVTDFSLQTITREIDTTERGTTQATFTSWLYTIAKESFCTLSVEQLMKHELQLRYIYDEVTYQRGDARYYSSKYDITIVNANIRKAFAEKRDFTSTEELIPQQSSLLNIANFTQEVHTDKLSSYYPEQTMVENIILDDKGKLKIDPKVQQLIQLAEETGNPVMAETLRKQKASHPQKNRSFHYLPYHTGSGFEQTFLKDFLTFPQIEDLNLEVYYNGDRAMTEFKIKCYKRSEDKWFYIGFYTPDFIIIQRKNGQIHKSVIVETKGEIYANDPKFKDKRKFIETEFLKKNNTTFGYERFDYLYLEDTMSENDIISITNRKITEFFGGVE
jgi:hypothetical protein